MTLIGPGYGECALVHIGDGQWIVIDSCIDQATGNCAALDYLESIGVEPGSVKLVVVTHWHDDHIRGISQLLGACDQAVIACSSAFGVEEFRKFIRAQSHGRSLATSSGTDEIAAALDTMKDAASKGRLRYAQAASRLYVVDIPELWKCEVWSLSPSAAEYQRFLTSLTRLMPNEKETMRRAPSPSRNDQAVAASIVFTPKDGSAETSMLFGSDLEEDGNPATGWSAVIASGERPAGMASIFKVAHHGSTTGHHDEVWSKMLVHGAWAILTPFQRGRVKLPTLADVDRIVELTDNAYISSDPGARKRSARQDRVVEKTLKDLGISLSPVQAEIGRLTLRRQVDSGSWGIEFGGSARALKSLVG